MKKTLIPLVVCLILLTTLVQGYAEAPIKVIFNGQELTLPVPAVIEEGTTLVPLRAIFEAFGVEPVWLPETRTIEATKAQTKLWLQVDNFTAKIGNNEVTLKVPPRIVNGRTLVPLRFISEAFGVTPAWDGTTRTIAINENSSVAVSKSPVSKFTKADIGYLGINFSGTQEQIADAILNWQVKNMIYPSQDHFFVDTSDAMRWNYIFPGIYPTNEMIREMRSEGKLYGICYNFATIYCSIAEYYGIKCRVTSMKEKPSQLGDADPETANGMSPEEFDRLKIKLAKKNLSYPYEAVRLIASETSAHYRAEVYINGAWVVKDATTIILQNEATGYGSKYKFYEVNWSEGEQPDKLAEYIKKLNSGERLGEGGENSKQSPVEQVVEARKFAKITGELDKYVGITDELGQAKRTANIDDFMKGLGLLPYINGAEAISKFVKRDDIAEDYNTLKFLQQIYEQKSGKPFYILTYCILGYESGIEPYYKWYEFMTGDKLDTKVFQEIYDTFASYFIN